MTTIPAQSSNTQVMIVTCIKDEAWILPAFLATCSEFADQIFIYDEATGLDDSRKIYPQFPKTQVTYNDGPPLSYDIKRKAVFEKARQAPLLPGKTKKLFVAIDGDEILSSNILNSPEWKEVLAAEPGTLFFLQWVNLWKSTKEYKIDHPTQYGIYNRTLWMDDGKSPIPDQGIQGMHMVYTPMDAKKKIYLKDIVCIHYQFLNWERMESKHRWYRAHEKLNIKKLSDLAIWRIYGNAKNKTIDTRPTLSEWFSGWEKKGINVSQFQQDDTNYYDLQVLEWVAKYGPETLKNEDIWDADWDNKISTLKKLNRIPDVYEFREPKHSLLSKLFVAYVKATQDVVWIRFLEKKIFRKGFFYDPKPITRVIADRVSRIFSKPA